jgi:signal transduction histidine kinase
VKSSLSLSAVVENAAQAVRVGIVRDLADEKRAAKQLADMNIKLVDASRMAGMADVASGILHNVGNVLNSVNVSVTLLDDTVRRSNAEGVVKIAALLKSKSEAEGGLAAFFAHDEKAKKVPDFVDALAKQLSGERGKLGEEIGALRKNVDHIREIVAMQQAYTSKSGVSESLQILDVVNDAAELSIDTKGRGEIEVIRDFDELPILTIDRHRTMQILVNLLRNARHAVRDSHRDDPRITIRVRNRGDRFTICVEDNGIGVAAQNFARLFEQGFTTKKDGHGYGLHSSANVARELGGSLTAHSEGAGRGATFTLDLPLTPFEQQAQRKEAA